MPFLNEQRKLTILEIENILRKNLPMERDKLVALIMYKMGFRKQLAKEYLKVIFDLDIIGYDKDMLLIWKKKE